MKRACAFAVGTLMCTLLSAGGAQADEPGATLGFLGTVHASEAGLPLLMTIPGPLEQYSYQALDNELALGSSIDGFTSLAGASPSDLTLTASDLELIGYAFEPDDCTPVGGASFVNCDAAQQHFGEGDLSPNFLQVDLAGTGTILSGDIVLLVIETDSDLASPTFGQSVGFGYGFVTGGISPYYEDAMALTSGSGLVEISVAQFDSLCFPPGQDPCSFNNQIQIEFNPLPALPLLGPVSTWALMGALGALGAFGARRRSSLE